MSKRLLNIPTLAALALTADLMTSCVLHVTKRDDGDMKEAKKEYTVSKPYTSIDCETYAEIIYTVSDTISITAESTATDLKHLQINVDEDSVLHIYRANDDGEYSVAYKKGYNRGIKLTPGHGVALCKLYISGPAFSKLNLSGASRFNSEGCLKTPSMNITISGASDADIKEVITGNFSITADGASDIDIDSLKADNVSIATFGAGDVDAKLYDVKNTFMSISGAGDMDIDFTNCGYAKAEVSGAGDIELSGTLHELDKSVSGAADIKTEKLTLK